MNNRKARRIAFLPRKARGFAFFPKRSEMKIKSIRICPKTARRERIMFAASIIV